MSTRSMSGSWIAVALLSTFGLGACGDSTGPSDEGRVSAVLGDAPSASQVSYQASRWDAPSTASAAFQGQMSGSAQVFIYSDAQGWVSLGSPASANLTLQSSDRTTVQSEASVPVGSYTRVRLVLQNGSANIAAGARLGGLVLTSAVTITMGGPNGQVVIEKTVTPFTITASSRATVEFDLNSETWVNESTAQSRTASATEIQSATEARVVTQ